MIKFLNFVVCSFGTSVVNFHISEHVYLIHCVMVCEKIAKDLDVTELQIRGSIEDNSKIIFLISQGKHML